LLGAASPLLVLLHGYLSLNIFSEQSDLYQLFGYMVIDVGIIEELSKTAAFLIVLLLFGRQMTDPIDYLVCMSMCALGFATTENFMYANRYSEKVLDVRVVWPVFAHIFDSSMIAYGIVYNKFVLKKNYVTVWVGFFLIAALTHGIYDFMLSIPGVYMIIPFVLFYFVTVSVYSTILNNCLNLASGFTYEKVVFPIKILNRFLIIYVCIILISSIKNYIDNGFVAAYSFLIVNLLTSSSVMVIVFLRLSRFRLIQGRWKKIKLELPFTQSMEFTNGGLGAKIVVKGDRQNEAVIGSYYHRHIVLHPVMMKNSYFEEPRNAYIEEKLFLFNDDIFYKVKIYSANNDEVEEYILKSKSGTTQYINNYPIVAVLELKDPSIPLDQNITIQDFLFVEWSYIKPEIKIDDDIIA
jgi:hypothetical protein